MVRTCLDAAQADTGCARGDRRAQPGAAGPADDRRVGAAHGPSCRRSRGVGRRRTGRGDRGLGRPASASTSSRLRSCGWAASTRRTRRRASRTCTCPTSTGSSSRSTARWRTEPVEEVDVLHEFRMPDAGEGLTEAEVLAWRVSVGDVVIVNQVLLEVETAKAAVELPSPYAGTVVAAARRAGADRPGRPADHPDRRRRRRGRCPAAGRRRCAGDRGRPAGRRPRARRGAGRRPQRGDRGRVRAPGGAGGLRGEGRAGPAPQATVHPARGRPRGGRPARRGGRPVRHGGLELGRAVERRLGGEHVRAKPPVRRLARDLYVDLAEVVPTGPEGTITHDDVARAAQPQHPAAPGTGPRTGPAIPRAGRRSCHCRTWPG